MFQLGPLATADGAIRAQIRDAHLSFDADVTVPIRHGRIDFNDVTVEHVGPDSRMGVSPQGLYVDAPNGRNLVVQFGAAPVDGVEYERRDALLGPWVSDRGSLQLQPFGEWLLGEALAGQGLGATDQASLLLARTSLTGDLHFGDGRIAGFGVQAELVGRANGHNTVRLHAPVAGQEITARIDALQAKEVVLDMPGVQLSCDEFAGAITLRLFVEGAKLRCDVSLETVKISGLHFTAQAPTPK